MHRRDYTHDGVGDGPRRVQVNHEQFPIRERCGDEDCHVREGEAGDIGCCDEDCRGRGGEVRDTEGGWKRLQWADVMDSD